MPSIPNSAIVQFEEAAYSPNGSGTIVANELLGFLSGVGIFRPEFINKGVQARVLTPGGQWQDGTVKIALDFTPQAVESSPLAAPPGSGSTGSRT